MAEAPMKLFATRAERYPETTDADFAQGAARAALAAIPVVGGSITEVMSMVLAPAITRRRDTWLKELADALDQLEQKVDGFKVENLKDDEVFISAVIDATRTAIGTHKDEKRAALRNALLNLALGQAPEEDLQQMFLRYIDELTGTHVQLLRFLSSAPDLLHSTAFETQGFSTYRQVLQIASPRLGGQHDLVRQVLIDLHSRGLSTVKNADDSLTNMPALTGHGRAFLNFVSLPQMLRPDGK